MQTPPINSFPCHYYPFGLNQNYKWLNNTDAPDTKYQYNGKELNGDHGLGWYSYGVRWYDPAVIRFWSVDPVASDYVWVNGYNYAENEPVAHIDLWGMQQVKPEMNKINKPGDMVSMKMLSNAAQGLRTVALELLKTFLPAEGGAGNEDYQHAGTGKELLSDVEVPGNGSVSVPTAANGSDQILSQNDFIFLPPEAGGVAGDAAVGLSKTTNAMYYGGMALGRTADAKQETEKYLDNKVTSGNPSATAQTDTTTTSDGQKYETTRNPDNNGGKSGSYKKIEENK